MSEGSPKNPAEAPRPKPPVPTGATPAAPALQEGNPFLPADSWSKISASKLSSSKIDAAWEEPDEAPRSPATPLAEPAPPPPVAKVEPTPEPPLVKRSSRGKPLAFVLLALVVLGGGGFAYQSQVAARSAKTQVAAREPVRTTAEPVSTTEPPPPPTFTVEKPPPSASVAQKPAAAAAAPVRIDPESQAFLDATKLPPGRKIVVDGRVVGTSPRKIAVRCGAHRIQIGDQDPESVDFPCGGEVNFTE